MVLEVTVDETRIILSDPSGSKDRPWPSEEKERVMKDLEDIFDEIVMYEGPGTPYVSRINNIIRECRKVPEGMKQDEAIEEAYSLLSAVRGCHS
ncbi:MAG: hypothetical protein ABL899_02135 [Nitrospira sp.]